jgi:Uma2 family endonuclease
MRYNQRMNIAAPAPRFATLDEFFAWHERQEITHDLVHGRPVMHVGVVREHERISGRIYMSLGLQIDEAEFAVSKAEFGIDLGPDEDGWPGVRYPDVVVDRQSEDGKERATNTALVVVEVLSTSTAREDLRDKPVEFGRLPTVVSYLVFDPEGPSVSVWRRADDGTWPVEPASVAGLDAVIDLPEIGAKLALAEIYRPVGRPRLSASS